MSDDPKTTQKTAPQDKRQERLNAALRENLHKRKLQARKRSAPGTAEDKGSDGAQSS